MTIYLTLMGKIKLLKLQAKKKCDKCAYFVSWAMSQAVD